MSDDRIQTTGPEMSRLLARLFDNPKRKLVNFNAWWGPDAEMATVEQRAAAINRMLDADERGETVRMDHFPDDGPEPRDVRDWLKELGL